LLTTLGDVVAIPKSRRWGVAWNVEEEGSRWQAAEIAHGGEPHAGLGACGGVVLSGKGEASTLGDACGSTLGCAGAGQWVGWRDGGARRCHELKIS
jgi:hypothetical protein